MRKLIVAMVLAALLPSSIAFADVSVYRPENTKADGTTQIIESVWEPTPQPQSSLSLQPPAVGIGGVRGQWQKCSSIDDPLCDRTNPTIDVFASLIAQYCASPTQLVCIQSLEIAAPGKEFKRAVFERAATEGDSLTASPALGFPGGETPLLFSAEGAPGQSGTTRYVVAMQTHWHWQAQKQKFYTNMFEISVSPVIATQGSKSWACLYWDTDACGMSDDWVPGTRARLTFRLPDSVGGWFKGRLKDPRISVAPGPGDNHIVTVEAEPVSVPRLVVVQDKATLTAEQQNWLQNNGTRGGYQATSTGYDSSQDGIAHFIDTYRALAHDTSAGINTLWNLSTTWAARGNRCLEDTSQVVGIVTTNATGYDGGSPAFEDGTLTYHVSGLHYAPDGATLNTGTYDLVMRSDAARCLYGFSSAPVSATVSVIDDRGEQKAAVTTVNEKDGWLKMAAYGFTFSNPIVHVKLTQEQPKVAPSASPTASATPSSSASVTPASQAVPKKVTITCVKGKQTKKVTAVKPTCPAGWKKR